MKGQLWVFTGSPLRPKSCPDFGIGQVLEFRRADGASSRAPITSIPIMDPGPPLGGLPKVFCFDASVITEQDCPESTEVWIHENAA